jgi:hypothetical protein
MRASALLVSIIGVVACTPPSAAPSADAGAHDASTAEVTDAGAPDPPSAADAAAPTETAPTDAGPARRSCGDLTPVEKRALETCAYKSVAMSLGGHGRRGVRLQVSASGLMRIRAENDNEHEFGDAQPDSECAKAGKLLAPLAPCAWDLEGPFGGWTIRVVDGE